MKREWVIYNPFTNGIQHEYMGKNAKQTAVNKAQALANSKNQSFIVYGRDAEIKHVIGIEIVNPLD